MKEIKLAVIDRAYNRLKGSMVELRVCMEGIESATQDTDIGRLGALSGSLSRIARNIGKILDGLGVPAEKHALMLRAEPMDNVLAFFARLQDCINPVYVDTDSVMQEEEANV